MTTYAPVSGSLVELFVTRPEITPRCACCAIAAPGNAANSSATIHEVHRCFIVVSSHALFAYVCLQRLNERTRSEMTEMI